MNYQAPLKYHFRPKTGWINDPNGLVFFQGYYHAFYQHAPHQRYPFVEPMYWGHARTKDFLSWEELPLALCPTEPYDKDGCWSGTALSKDGVLYLFYASICRKEGEDTPTQSVSLATSRDGIHFEKYEGNPVISGFPSDGCPDFRDPAVAKIGDKYVLVMASGHVESKKARLLLYESPDLLSWEYQGILAEWDDARYAECPSIMPFGEKVLLSASVCHFDRNYFSAMLGTLEGGHFTPEISASIDRGPDQYAGQIFRDDQGRCIHITWIPGWAYHRFAENDVGCLSLPREILVRDGKLCAYPVKEVQHLLRDSDPAVTLTAEGCVIAPHNTREPVVHKGKIQSLAVCRDEYILEVFINGGETVYSVLL